MKEHSPGGSTGGVQFQGDPMFKRDTRIVVNTPQGSFPGFVVEGRRTARGIVYMVVLDDREMTYSVSEKYVQEEPCGRWEDGSGNS